MTQRVNSRRRSVTTTSESGQSRQGEVQRFRFSAKAKQKSLLILLVTLPFYGGFFCVLIGLIALSIFLFTQETRSIQLVIFVAAMDGFFIPLLLIPLSIFVSSLWSLFASYLEIAPEGVTYRNRGQFTVHTLGRCRPDRLIRAYHQAGTPVAPSGYPGAADLSMAAVPV
jgi:hypothetical protein